MSVVQGEMISYDCPLIAPWGRGFPVTRNVAPAVAAVAAVATAVAAAADNAAAAAGISAVIGAAAVSGSCARRVDPIVRVQPDHSERG